MGQKMTSISPIISNHIDKMGGARPQFNVKAFIAKYGGTAGTKVSAKQLVYSQGDQADCIYYIQAGTVHISVISEQGKEANIATLEAGDLCGEGCLIGDAVRTATAQAITECVVARLDKAAVMRAIHDDPTISEFFALYALRWSSKYKDDLLHQLFNSSEKRLARVLLTLTNFGKEGRSEPVIQNINQDTLARMVGTTRSRINYFMNKFRRLGYIEYNGTINVHSSLLNVILPDRSTRSTDGSDTVD
jgi:CRP-like cAMP-binding protein